MIPGLDHIGIVGADLSAMETAYARLGFTVAPRCELVALAEDGGATPLGQVNSHLVFGRTYVELTAVEGDLETHHLRDAIARYFGFHIVVLTADDVEAARRRIITGGIEAPPTALAGREVRYPGGGGMAGFRWFRVPDADLPDAFVCYVEQLTSDLVFDASLNDHPNGARDVRDIFLCVDDPADAAARFAKASGAPVTAAPDGPRVDLAVGRARFLDTEALFREFPGVAPPALPWAAGFTVSCPDFAATRRFFRNSDLPWHDGGDRLWIEPDFACGTIVAFAPPA